MQILRILLFPISVIYGVAVNLRNILYDHNILKSTRSPIPTIVIGNIHMGGTGKTPHTIWLTQQLLSHNPAILSRGYGRKTKGFAFVNEKMDASETGDEVQSFIRHFPNIQIAVSEDRVLGCQRIADQGKSEVIILDDAFQHRKLKGDFNLCLIRADQNPKSELYFPSGNIRDAKRRLKQADAILITHSNQKNQHELKSSIQKVAGEKVPVFFSQIDYCAPSLPIAEGESVILITGIANAKPLAEHVGSQYDLVFHFNYRDHQVFTDRDILKWKEQLKQHPGAKLVTTRKDYDRLTALNTDLQRQIAVIDIEVNVEEDLALIAQIRAVIEKKG